MRRDTPYRDDDLSGFALRAKPSGARTWVVQYRNSAGRTRKLALGRVGVLTPEEARQRARKALGRVAAGEDPSATRNAARGAMTVADLCRDYLAATDKGQVLGKGKRPKSETTIATDRNRIACHIIPHLGTLAVADVRQADVSRFMHAVQAGTTARVPTRTTNWAHAACEGGSGSASRTVGTAGGIFSYAVRHGLRADNPVRGVERPPDGRRTTFLSGWKTTECWARRRLLDAEREGENPSLLTPCDCWH